MSLVTHSPFLQALGYAIINSLWQFALLWVIYVLVNTFLLLSSHQKYVVGLLSQMGGFVWFIVTFTFYFHGFLQSSATFLPFQKTHSFYIEQVIAVTAREKLLTLIIQLKKLLPYLSVAYLLLLVYFSIRWIKVYHFTHSLKTKGLHKTEVYWKLFVQQLSNQLGIKHEVKIYLSELIKTPSTIGFFKPLILIPLASLHHLTTDQMEAVIVHELAHIKRFDYLFNLFLALIETILFFNPFTILISNYIKQERENCCDDWVLQHNYNATSYASALLQIATLQSSAYSFAVKATDNKQLLLNRIKRIIEKKETNFFNYSYKLVVLLVMITVLSSLSLLSTQQKVKNKILLSSVNVTVQQRTAELDKSSFHSGISLTQVNENYFSKKKQQIYKKVNRAVKNKKPQINQQRLNTKLPPTEFKPVLSENNYSSEIPEEYLKRDNEILNISSDELLSGSIAYKEQEIALAEKRFEKIALQLLKERKPLFDQEQLIEEIKAAVEQIKAVKIQLAFAKNRIARSKVDKKAEAGYQKANILQQIRFDMQKREFMLNQLQTQIEEAERRFIDSTKPDVSFNNNEIQFPQVIFNVPSQNTTHNFSFDFSEKPRVKAIFANDSKNHPKVKKINKVYIEADENFANEILPPSVREEKEPKVEQVNRTIYIIRI